MSNTPTIEELQNLTAAEVIEQVGSLDAERAAALRELEAADKDGGRKTVLAAIDKRLADLAGTGGGAGAGGEQTSPAGAQDAGGERTPPAGRQGSGRGAQPSAAAPAAADAPAWQQADYDGPLTIPQAAWRRENIKPAQEPRTK